MARWSGEMEFEFVEGASNFVATDKVVQFIRGHLAKGEVQHAAALYEDKVRGCATALLQEAASASSSSQKALAEMFVIARDFGSAAQVFELARQWERAAQNYEAAHDYENAARLYVDKINDLPRAAVCFERAGNTDRAIDIYKRAGPSQPLAEALARQGHYYDAAAVYRHIFNLKAEIDMLRLVPIESEARVPAMLRLAELLEQYNYPDQAVGVLVETIKTCAHARLHQPMYVQLAGTFERMGRLQEATQVKERIHNLLSSAGSSSAPAALPAALPVAVTPQKPVPSPVAAAPQFTTVPLHIAKDPFPQAQNPFGTALPSPGGSNDPIAPNAYAHLKALPIFAELDLMDMKELYRACEDVHVAPGQVLVEVNAPGRGLFVIVDGQVRVVRADGAELATLGAGAQVGELSLIDDVPTSARVLAGSQVLALFVSRERFLHFMETRPNAALRIYRLFSRSLAARLRQANQRH